MTQQPVADVLDRTAIFGSVDVQGAGLVASKANFTCVFGSVKVELRVPAAWRVVMDVQPLFGDLKERGAPPTPDAPTLRVRGTVLFGDAELERF